MSKVSIPLPEFPTSGSVPNLSEIRDGLRSGLYDATPAQKRCKASFWARHVPGPLSPSPQDMSLAFVQEVTGTAGLKKWWSEIGFRSWFLNRDENKERLEYLFDRSLDAAEEILNSDQAKGSDKVAVIKLIADLAGKTPRHGGQDKFADSDINAMDEKQLEAYLTKKGVNLLGPAQVSDAEIINSEIIDEINPTTTEPKEETK
jgi:hypothetical protein